MTTILTGARIRVALGVAAIAGGALTLLGQAPTPRILTESPGLPGIDRGVDVTEPIRAPGGRLERAITGSGAAYIPGRVIVKFRGSAPADTLRMVSATLGAQPQRRQSYANFDVLSLDPDQDPEVVAQTLAARSDVEYAQASYIVHPNLTPNDAQYPMQWSFPLLDMERAWEIQPGATPSIIVAVLDSGVAARDATYTLTAQAFRIGSTNYPALGTITVPVAVAPDLAGPDRFVAPRDFIWDDNAPVDFDGHGTHVAGTIGQVTNNGVGGAGMAFNVRLMPVKVIAETWDEIFGAPNRGTDDVVARGVRYAVDNGAKVLNMSIGRTGPPAPVVEDALEYAVSRGAFVSIAAGNEFEDGNEISRPADSAERIDGVVAVAAVGRTSERSFFSSTGSYVELAAPGGDQRRNSGNAGGVGQQTLDSSFSETFRFAPSAFRAPRFDVFAFRFFQGTSMAAPHVAGFAALLMQQGITSPAAIEAAMKQYARDLGTPGRDPEYGFGLIQPRATLRGLGVAR